MKPPDFAPLLAFQTSQDSLQTVLLKDCFALMEHGDMSLAEVLTMPLSFIKDYQNSGLMQERLKIIDYENEKIKAVLGRLDNLITVSARR